MRHSKYLFGIIRNNNEQMRLDNIKEKSLGKIYSISYQDISGVVRDYPGDRFDFGTREEVAKKLVSHQTVIEKVMENFSIIPIKFGTVIRDEQEVKRILIKAYWEFKESLEKFREKIELDVVVSWKDLNALIKKIGDENKEIRDLKEKISQKQKKEDVFQEKIKIGAMIKEVIDKKKDDLQKEIIEILSSKTKIENVKKHELMNDSMILNCGFLLHKEKEKEFNNALHELNDYYNDSLKFRCLGPLPLYSFLTYEIKRVDVNDIDQAKELLDLPHEFKVTDIKESYRHLIKEKHPDKFPHKPEAQKEFEEIQKAYKLLMDCYRHKKKPIEKDNKQSDFVISIFNNGSAF